MDRPRAVARLSKILIVLGLSALGGVIGLPWGTPIRVAPQLLVLDPITTTWVIHLLAITYCGATLACAFSLWRMLFWARAAYICFVASVVIYLTSLLCLVRVPSPISIAVLFFGLLGAGLFWGWRVVASHLPTRSEAL